MAGAARLRAAPVARISLLLELNRPQEAEKVARQLLASSPNDSQALGLLGLCLLRQRRVPEAIRVLSSAIGADPTSARAFAWLAEAQIEAKELDSAQAYAEKALRLAPFEAAFHGLLGMVNLAQLRPKKALRAARAGLALDPTEALCQNVQARALAALGNAESGIVTLGVALAQAPADPAFHTNLGLNYLDAGKHEAAEAHFLEGLRLQPGNAVARQGLLGVHKSRFWLYRAIHRLIRMGVTLLRLTGIFNMAADLRKILLYVLQVVLLFGMWGWALSAGYFNNAGLFTTGLLLLLFSPLGLMLILILLALALRFFFLTLLRLNPVARPLLSRREVVGSNFFLAATLLILLGIAAYWRAAHRP